MEDIFIFIAVLWVVAAILWIIVGALKKKQDSENETKPVRKATAKIVDKQQIESGAIVIGEPWVLFETEDGERIRLNVKADNHLVVGDRGVLTWQGRKVLSFERVRN